MNTNEQISPETSRDLFHSGQLPLTRFPFLKRHWAALALAFLVGMISIAPCMYFASHAPHFTGIELAGADAEDHYTARINEVYKGFPAIGNTFLPQKNIPYLIPGLGENLVARLGMTLGLTAPEVSVFAKFLCPLLATLLIYTLGWLAFRSRGAALLGAGMVMWGDGLFSGLSQWLALLHGSSSINTFLSYDRPINPEISGPLLFGTLICIYQIFFAGRKPHLYEPVICGLLTGLALYVSPYIVSFLVVVQVICGIFALIRRNWNAVAQAVSSGLVALLTAVPFIVNYLAARSNPAYSDALERLGISHSHAPMVGFWLPIIVLLALFIFPRIARGSRWFFVACAGALLILVNQQILTGQVLQPGHYHWYITIPLVGMIAGLYASTLARLWTRPMYHYGFLILVMAFLAYNAVSIQVRSYWQGYSATVEIQKYGPLMSFLNVMPGRQFVWADSFVSSLIAVYTANDTANDRQAPNYLVPRAYFEHALLLSYRLRDVKPADIRAVMTAERGDISAYVYALYWRNQAGSFEAIPDSILDSLANQYIRSYSLPLTSEFKQLGVTVLVLDRQADQKWKIPTVAPIHKIYADESVVVYGVR
jgi:hypothetical protein